MSQISLTASMRSNLLSLQGISGQVSLTQNRLSTGLKVNSAIDNPANYYAANSLNNRAADLGALLDSMGQAVQTVKAANETIESAAKFLEQAASVAAKALELNKIPAKSWFESKVGANGAVVTTAQELKDAVAANKETIVVYGKIDMADTSLTLKDSQKLVGVGYYGNFDTETDKFSSLTFKSDQALNAIILENKTLLSDLSVRYENTIVSSATNYLITAISVSGAKTATVKNIDVNLVSTNPSAANGSRRALFAAYGATLNLEGKNNIKTTGVATYGIVAVSNSALNISGDVNIETKGFGAFGIYAYDNSTANINGNVNIQTSGQNAHVIYTIANSTSNINGNVNIQTSGIYAHVIVASTNSTANINGELNIRTMGSGSWGILSNSSSVANNTINITASAEVYIANSGNFIINQFTAAGTNPNTLIIEQGAKIAMKDTRNGVESYFDTKERFENINTSTTTSFHLTPAVMTADPAHFTPTPGTWPTIDFDALFAATAAKDSTDKDQYSTILAQYDNLIKDSSYKGVNLLKGDNLNVKFDGQGESKLEVTGKDLSSATLGMTTKDWQTQGDIAKSLSEIASALKGIRSFSAELGNNYSIITTRQDFTENLINVLTEGADKLTLADMNEESANMLALQTRQQLAINSLSLASQAAQSVLKLF